MLAIRSALFNIVFYVNIIVLMIFWTPFYFVAPRKNAWYVPKLWARSSMWWQKLIVGTEVDYQGVENLPQGSYIIAPKHQSFWDTFAFLPHIPDAVYILKRELMWIPMFGWYLAKMRMTPIERGSRSKALRMALATAKECMAEGRQLIIYPEGTRRAPGAEPSYKYGIVELYDQLKLPVVPIAHVAGLYWPRRRFARYPGTIRVRILPAIPAGLPRDEFQKRLVDDIEKACDELLLEAAGGPNPPAMPPTAIKRLRELGFDKHVEAALTD